VIRASSTTYLIYPLLNIILILILMSMKVRRVYHVYDLFHGRYTGMKRKDWLYNISDMRSKEPSREVWTQEQVEEKRLIVSPSFLEWMLVKEKEWHPFPDWWARAIQAYLHYTMKENYWFEEELTNPLEIALYEKMIAEQQSS